VVCVFKSFFLPSHPKRKEYPQILPLWELDLFPLFEKQKHKYFQMHFFPSPYRKKTKPFHILSTSTKKAPKIPKMQSAAPSESLTKFVCGSSTSRQFCCGFLLLLLAITAGTIGTATADAKFLRKSFQLPLAKGRERIF
jgi:hypothetical protein